MNTEEWKDVVGYEGYYQVSSLGNVRSVDRYVPNMSRWGTEKMDFIKGKPMKLRMVGNYLGIKFNRNKKKLYYIQVLVARAFIPNPAMLPEVNHINGIKTDNRVENLEWNSRQQNVEHAYNTGLAPSGSSSHYAKLTERTVAEIIHVNNTSGLTYPKVGELFGMCAESVSNMCRGKSWNRPHVRQEINEWLRKFESGEETISVDIKSVTVSNRNWRRR